jgi:glycosyltransferase involved in cell wall biosynthesis
VGRRRLVVFAWACQPSGHTEAVAGWGLVRALARRYDCVVLVSPPSLEGIRKAALDEPALEFVGVQEPRWGRWGRTHLVCGFLRYWGWLALARREAQRIHALRPFDAAVHATLSTYWLPSPVGRLGIPSVWGPVGGAVATPPGLRSLLGWRGQLAELREIVAVRLAALLPATRRTWREVTRVIVQNEETLGRLPRAVRGKARVLNHVNFIEFVPPEPVPRKDWLLNISPLQARKGVALLLRALAEAPDAPRQLVIAGNGPERESLEALARELGVQRRVRFLGGVSRTRVLELLAECHAAVFTGLREEGGVALGEAMLSGAPLIVLAHGGARTLAASAADPRRVVLVPPAGVGETAQRLAQAFEQVSQPPDLPAAARSLLDVDAAVQALAHIVDSAIHATSDPTSAETSDPTSAESR